MKKCDKYQAYFLFSNEAEFEKHLAECEDCRAEHEKFEKISSLVKEVAPAYTKRSRSKAFMAKVACVSVIMMFSFSFAGFYMLNPHDEVYMNYAEGSVVGEMGYPTDNYGLLYVD